MPERSWNLLSSKYVGDYKIIRVREDRYSFGPEQAETDFIVCDSADWVLAIALTKENEVVFVRQYRHGLRCTVLEVPGGVMDPGESPEASAARELREETGYVAEETRYVGKLMPNPALNDAHYHVVLAEGCHLAGPPSPDPFEKIHVELRPLDEVAGMIQSGELAHALVVAAFARFGKLKFS